MLKLILFILRYCGEDSSIALKRTSPNKVCDVHKDHLGDFFNKKIIVHESTPVSIRNLIIELETIYEYNFNMSRFILTKLQKIH